MVFHLFLDTSLYRGKIRILLNLDYLLALYVFKTKKNLHTPMASIHVY